MPAKRRRTSKKTSSSRTRKKSTFGKGFVDFIFSSKFLIFLLIVVVAGLIYWFLPEITGWMGDTWDALSGTLGIGLLLILIAILLLIWVISQNQWSAVFKGWNYWLGAISLCFAAWGIVALFNPALSGSFGTSIISDSVPIGILRIIGLVFLGILIIAPKRTAQTLLTFASGTVNLLSAVWGTSTKAAQTKHTRPVTPIKPERSAASYEMPEITTHDESTYQEPAPPAAPPPQEPQEAAEVTIPAAWEPGDLNPMITPGGWQLPPVSILDKPAEAEITQEDVEKRAQLITESLASYGVDAKVVQINVGPTVTQYGVEPGWDRKFKEIKEKDKDGSTKVRIEEVSKTRVKVDRISALGNDLALALAAPSIRIEAPVPGKSIVGIEVPNTTFGAVNLRGIIESSTYQKLAAKTKLAIALGKGAGGETVNADLAKMPHLLVAGATGSGKTVYLNSTICCLLIYNTPDDLRFVMIDPKRVELVSYNSLPHLIAPVVVDTDKAVLALHWLTQEMDERYRKFAKAGARNIESYNKDRESGDKMPYIVLVIDELADLMMTAFDEVEHTLCRLAQLARATGIHLIVATQRPSVDVVTGLIKANFPTRLSFALTSQVDSRTIIDSAGAEKLLGRGDMLFMPTDASKPKRLQGPFLSDAEIERLVNFWGNQRRPDAVPVSFEDVVQPGAAKRGTEDALLETARQLARDHNGVSTSYLQRKLRIGYPRAARIAEQLKEEGLFDDEEDEEE
jgi:S-DNA-T family DNA segregation ATPase FtsK/SpoIIIE